MKKKPLFAVPLLALMGFGLSLGLSSGNAIAAKAEGEETSIVSSEEASIEASEETEAVESEVAEGEGKKSVTEVASEWIENKVIPLLGGVSIATLISVAVSIATAIMKHRGDVTNRKVISAQDLKIEALQQIVGILQKALDERSEYEKRMLEQYALTLTDTEATMQQVANYAKTISELVANQNVEIEGVERMKSAIETSCTLIAKSLSLSETAVKSGIAKDAQRLVATLKGGHSDGQEG